MVWGKYNILKYSVNICNDVSFKFEDGLEFDCGVMLKVWWLVA